MKFLLSKVVNSSPYRRSKRIADAYLRNPDKLSELIEKSQHRAEGGRYSATKEALVECREAIAAFCRLLKAYATGRYKEVSWDTLMLLIASLVYFVMPFDFLPDVILALGLMDDAALIAWTLKAVKGDVDRFVEWEQEQSSPHAELEKENSEAVPEEMEKGMKEGMKEEGRAE